MTAVFANMDNINQYFAIPSERWALSKRMRPGLCVASPVRIS